MTEVDTVPRIALDRSGNLREAAFYRFDVPFEDVPVFAQIAGAVVVPRTPTNAALLLKGQETYRWVTITGDSDSLKENKDCPLDSEHVTQRCFTRLTGEAYGGSRMSPIIPASGSDTVVVSNELRSRIQGIKLRAAKLDSINLTRRDNGPLLPGFWALQFVGRARLRLPKLIDTPNICPHCAKAQLMCEGCGEWYAYCLTCKRQMVITESMHGGSGDNRLPMEEDGIWRVIEGKDWDGSDLIQVKCTPFVSKRFIDWLLRIHAAPFYAEPVYFCVDGMSDQQRKWFDDLQKPLDA